MKRKKLIQWSILQHYEIADTPLIDITQSLRVACSFAQLKNKSDKAFVYVFGLPYYSNRISINSEHDLVNIRLLSITPPEALRPYYQEGFLVGTDDITNEYENKGELDLNNRLIAKFEIKNNNRFWGNDFDKIPFNALYPKDDRIIGICNEIKSKVDSEIAPQNLGEYLRLWSKLENKILVDARNYKPATHNIRNAISILKLYENKYYKYFKYYDEMRLFRNKIIEKPLSISNQELNEKIKIIKSLNSLNFNKS